MWSTVRRSPRCERGPRDTTRVRSGERTLAQPVALPDRRERTYSSPVEAPDSIRVSQSRRGCIWWIGIATIVVVVLVAGAFIWGHFTVWHVSKTDHDAAVRAVERAARSPSAGAACLRSNGRVTCLVTTTSG